MGTSFPFHGVNECLKPHLDRVISGDEYDLPGLSFGYAPTILDIGANVGAYSYWALNRFPGAVVFAYEPSKDNVDAYTKNLTETHPSGTWRLFHGAVTKSTDSEISLYLSQVNTGMHSIHKELTNTRLAEVVQAPNYHPNRLPNCDILKMDTEGCEVEILHAYLPSHVLPSIISLEFHSRLDYYEIERFLSKDYIPFRGYISHPDLGTINYVRNDLAEQVK